MPSLLGGDIIEEFGLFMYGRTDRILLLQDAEVPEELFKVQFFLPQKIQTRKGKRENRKRARGISKMERDKRNGEVKFNI